jgi:hypothetical protein
MRRRLGSHLTYANVMVTLLAFVVLGGGAYAAFHLPKNSVRSRNIKNGQVKTPDLANSAVTASKVGCAGNSAQDKMVRAGSVCIDKYEDSIWTKKTGGTQITGSIPCSNDGQNCKGRIFARSVKGVTPRANISWFQAQQALANSGKRLPSNAEWQQAVAGTPDSTTCNVNTGSVQNAGANPGCVSKWGAGDMVGNLDEWVGDWVPASSACPGPGWGAFSDDLMCLTGASTTAQGPGALLRGGSYVSGAEAGPFTVLGGFLPQTAFERFGFRGAR